MIEEAVHIREQAEDTIALCGATLGRMVPLDKVRDPESPVHFTCGTCWRALSDHEPMGR